MERIGKSADQGREHAGRLPRRRWLLGAAALPAALMLSGCDAGIPFLRRHEPGSCLPGSEELPEEVHDTLPAGGDAGGGALSADRRFLLSGLAVSPDGTLIAACESRDRVELGLAEEHGVILWDTASGEVLRRLSIPAQGPLSWHPDGTRLAIADARHIAIVGVDGDLLWNLIGHELPSDRPAHTMDVAHSPDGTQLASTSTDGTVRLWEVSGEQCGPGHVLEPAEGNGAHLSYSPDGAVLAVGGTSGVGKDDPDTPPELWDPSTGSRRARLDDVEGPVLDLGYGADGSLVALTHDPSVVVVVDPEGGISTGPTIVSAMNVELEVGPGSRVAVNSRDSELLIWDRATGAVERLAGVTIDQLRWSPDESVLYGLTSENGVRAWDGERWRQFDLP